MPSDVIVEIGPGRGVLTEALLQTASHLTVIEFDRDLAAYLTDEFSLRQRLTVIASDVLRVDFGKLKGDGPRLRVVGNLPYQISTPLLFKLVGAQDAIEDMCFMLQKEVVDRILAKPGSRDYGRLTVMLSQYCEGERLFNVGRGSFHPPPKVNSAVIRLTPLRNSQLDVGNQNHFANIVRQAFSARRKTVRNALKGWLDVTDLQALGIDPSARPEVLAPHDFAALSLRYGEKISFDAH
jgi:16S rRNA (adenine1518-N6/adenine1519-N6)-dimethyltransferase